MLTARTQHLFPKRTLCRWASTTKKSERPPYRAPDPLVNNPRATVKEFVDEGLTFIHRPPPTAPSPFSLTTAPVSPLLRPATGSEAPLPPMIRPSADKDNSQPSRVSPENLQRIRELRRSNPEFYSRGKLAKMFGCTEMFVARVAALPKPKRAKLIAERDAKHQEQREKWGEDKSLARAVRAKRREIW